MPRRVYSAESGGEPSRVSGRRYGFIGMMPRFLQQHVGWIPRVRSGAEGAVGGRGQSLVQNGEQRVGRRDSQDRDTPRLGNSSGARDRQALRRGQWRLLQFLYRGYCNSGVSLEETVRSSSLDVLGLRFLWDFSVHSFLPQLLVTLGVYEREGCVWLPTQSF